MTGEPLGGEAAEHVRRNRDHWNQNASDWVEEGTRKWAEAPNWGVWSVADSELGVLPADLAGREAIELGCGTGYVSSWLARRGAAPVGIDVSEAQLATARELQARHGLDFPLLHGDAEHVPRPEASFDLAISEYGASIWCEPERWVAEAARLLRPGGELIFLTNGVLAMLCDPDDGGVAGERFVRPYFGMGRFEWSDTDGVEFHLPHGELIALLGRNGLVVEELIEVQPPADATTRYPHMTLEWARKWPGEEIWKARKRGG